MRTDSAVICTNGILVEAVPSAADEGGHALMDGDFTHPPTMISTGPEMVAVGDYAWIDREGPAANGGRRK